MKIVWRFALCVVISLCVPYHLAWGFSFSEYEKNEEEQSRTEVVSLSSLNCPGSLKNKRIGTMIGESHRDDRPGYYRVYAYWNVRDEPNWDRRFGTRKAVYGSLVDDLNNSFRQLGLKTYTAEEINNQIAQEEQEAFLNNDLDAALAAAEKLKADYLLKGNISTHVQINKMVKVDEVFVTISLSLRDSSGSQISSARISETVFSDADIQATVQRLIGEQANNITYKLFSTTCKGGK